LILLTLHFKVRSNHFRRVESKFSPSFNGS